MVDAGQRRQAAEIFKRYFSPNLKFVGYRHFWKLPPGAPGPKKLFSLAVYFRGGMTLEALREKVGDAVFYSILRDWVAQHRYGERDDPAVHRSGRGRLGRLARPLLRPLALPAAQAEGLVAVCEHTFVSSSASILHADADAFFASVEQRDDPSLRGRPTIVGAGVVMAASYEARAYGIHGGMGGGRARRLCPHAAVVPPRFSAYTEASRALFDLFEETAPLVEGLSLEEAFLDVRGLERISGTPRQIAERLRRRARERIGLAVTVGVARTKVLAKMASRAAKPDGLLVIDPDREAEFLRPLPVEALWGVGVVTADKLRAHGIARSGSSGAATRGARRCSSGLTRRGISTRSSHNRDPRRVRRGRGGARSAPSRRSPGGGKSGSDLDALLVTLVDRVTRRARAANRAGRTVTLRFRLR